MGSRASALELMGKRFELGCCQRQVLSFAGNRNATGDTHGYVTALQYFYPENYLRLVRNPDFFPAHVLNPDLAEGASPGLGEVRVKNLCRVLKPGTSSLPTSSAVREEIGMNLDAPKIKDVPSFF